MNEPPDWLQSLADEVANLFHAVDILAPLGCHYCQIDGTWEITLFASRTEIVGGAADGRHRTSRFHMDLKSLMGLFDEVESAYWQAQGLGAEDDLGPHLGVEGMYAGRRVWLRIPSQAPRRFPAGRHAFVHQESWEELW